ncbi:MAG: hypothetical protein ACI959_000938 [Limisphaerales bacterium]|jgi:hypothetical protein
MLVLLAYFYIMIRIITILIALVPTLVYSQITITNADLPSAGNTYLMSIADTLIGITPEDGGPDYNWDYSFLEEISQLDENWISPLGTNPLYFSLFGISNVASDYSDLDFGAISLSDAFNFYNNSTSGFAQTGLAGVISSIPIPIPFDSPDEVLVFPTNYNDTWSGPSGFNLSIPGLATLVEERDRTSTVDGWGTLTTPYGTFDVLRVVSDIDIKDSLNSATLGDFVINRNTTEYRWMAAGMGAPVLQIDVQNIAGVSIVSRIVYQDSLRTEDTTSTGLEILNLEKLKLYPNPSSEHITLEFASENNSKIEIDLLNLNGQAVQHWNFITPGSGLFRETLTWNNVSSGKYLLSLRIDGKQTVLPVVIGQ